MLSAIASQFASITIHGLSRAAATKRFLRFLWSFLFLISVTIFALHLSLLVRRFRKIPINTELILEAMNFEFPSLVICNSNPISYSIHMHRKKLGIHGSRNQDAAERIRSGFDLLMENSLSSAEQFWLRSEYSTYTRYPESHNRYQTVIKAILNGKELDVSAFEAVPNNDHYKCFQFMNSSLVKSSTDKLTLYLYADVSHLNTDNFAVEWSSLTYSGEQVKDRCAELLLFFTEKGYYPGRHTEYLSISCGMHTDVDISMTARQKLSTKSDSCSREAKTVTVVNHLFPTEQKPITYKVDRALCEAVQMAKDCNSYCGCTPLTLPIPFKQRHGTARCLNVSHWSVNETVANFRCWKRYETQDFHDFFKRRCKNIEPCARNTYSLQWSAAVWPVKGLVETFVRDVLTKTYAQRVDENRTVPAWKTVLNASDSEKLALVRENIAKVDIRPKSRVSSKVIESEAYPAINLFSDIGGILGLYLGMSLLSLFELLESFLMVPKLLKATSKRNREGRRGH